MQRYHPVWAELHEGVKTILTQKMQKNMNYCNKGERKHMKVKISTHETVPCIAINNPMPRLQKKVQKL